MTEPKDPRWLIAHLPTDVERLAAIGRVAISHGFLDSRAEAHGQDPRGADSRRR